MTLEIENDFLFLLHSFCFAVLLATFVNLIHLFYSKGPFLLFLFKMSDAQDSVRNYQFKNISLANKPV